MTPTKPGNYWGVCLRLSDEEFELKPMGHPLLVWEVLRVYENGADPDDDEYLMVFVPGMSRSVRLSDVHWGVEVMCPYPKVPDA